MLLPWWSVQDTTGLEWIAELAFALAAAFAAAFLLVPRRYAVALPVLVLAYFVVVFQPIWAGSHGAEAGVRRARSSRGSAACRGTGSTPLSRPGRRSTCSGRAAPTASP